MRDDQLPSPGPVNGGQQLRRQCAKAISYIEVNKRADGTQPAAAKLKAFFDALSVECAKYDEVAPANAGTVTITGTAQVGQTLTAVPGGSWTGGGLTYTYQWQKNSVNIAGATNPTYVPVSGDIGAPIRVIITGTNTIGNLAKTSANTANVIA